MGLETVKPKMGYITILVVTEESYCSSNNECFLFVVAGLKVFLCGKLGKPASLQAIFRFFMDQKKTRKPRTFSGGGGGGGVGGQRIKLYTDNIKYYCNLKS